MIFVLMLGLLSEKILPLATATNSKLVPDCWTSSDAMKGHYLISFNHEEFQWSLCQEFLHHLSYGNLTSYSVGRLANRVTYFAVKPRNIEELGEEELRGAVEKQLEGIAAMRGISVECVPKNLLLR